MLKVFFQLFIIILPTLVSIFYKYTKLLLLALLELSGKSTTNLEIALESIIKNPIILSTICGVISSALILILIRRNNKEKIFNTGDKYHRYPTWIYWVASNVLGYGKVTMVRVPIFLQYKLLIKDTFPDILVDENVEEHEQEVIIIEKNMEKLSEELNLILEDTYAIRENSLPIEKLDLPTLIIKNGSEFNGNRIYNPKYIINIREKTNFYSRRFKKINIFSTTNTNHNKDIILKCFKNGGRTGFKRITVYQADTENYNFNKEYKII